MNADLQFLAQRLEPAMEAAKRPLRNDPETDRVVAAVAKMAKGGMGAELNQNLKLEVLRQFWKTHAIPSFRDAYFLSCSLLERPQAQAPLLIEDEARFPKLLSGLDPWADKKKVGYQFCYGGLLSSYFAYDPFQKDVKPSGKTNWQALREYLLERSSLLNNPDSAYRPGWVDALLANPALLSEKPCQPYGETVLHGDHKVVQQMQDDLQIDGKSWFVRQLVLSQIEVACRLTDAPFTALVPRLLELAAPHELIQDPALCLILNRYADVKGTPLQKDIRDYAVAWWRNPWLPSNESAWGGVSQAARDMVANWLKLEFIETFFTKLAEDGQSDPRRMEFWKRYVRAIDHIEFALGPTARSSNSKDMRVLRERMHGLICDLDAQGPNNAFIMWMGPLVVVEFSQQGNALYGYRVQESIPFDTSKSLRLAVDGRNSLKKASRDVWLQHTDGIHGWSRWEDRFEHELRDKFGIKSGAANVGPTRHRAPASAANTAAGPFVSPSFNAASRITAAPQVASPVPARPASGPAPFSAVAFKQLVDMYRLTTSDKTSNGGNLWVTESGALPERVKNILHAWGFRHKPGKGWWRGSW